MRSALVNQRPMSVPVIRSSSPQSHQRPHSPILDATKNSLVHNEAEKDTNSVILLHGEKDHKEVTATASPALIACVMYCLCSLLMTFSNKMLLAAPPVGYDFKYPSVLLLFQNAFSAFFVYSLSLMGVITIEPIAKSLVMKWLPVNILFVFMLLSGSYALRYLSVPMVTIFKNFTTMFITLGDSYYFGQKLSTGIVFSLLLMFFGSVVAALNDLEFRLDGYMWMVVNCIISAAYVLYMKIAMKGTKLSEFGSVFYNNFLSLPLIFVLTLMDGFGGITEYPLWSDPGFITVAIFSGFSSVSISFASFWTVKSTSPTTYSVVGSLNKIPLTIMGVLVFSTSLSFLGGLSIIIGLSGGVVYSLCKHKEWSTREAKK